MREGRTRTSTSTQTRSSLGSRTAVLKTHLSRARFRKPRACAHHALGTRTHTHTHTSNTRINHAELDIRKEVFYCARCIFTSRYNLSVTCYILQNRALHHRPLRISFFQIYLLHMQRVCPCVCACMLNLCAPHVDCRKLFCIQTSGKSRATSNGVRADRNQKR